MKMKNKLLELREMKKSKKPVFVARDSQRRKEVVQDSWRKPRGKHSKTRLHHAGNPKMPSQGYRSPKAVRGFHKLGLKPVVVASPRQLDTIKDEGIVISSAVGMKKRLEILKAAVAKKITVLNIDAQAFAKKAEEKLAEGKKKKAEKAAPKKQEKEKSSKEEKAPESEEDKRKAEKKEMEKIITKRD